MRIGRIVNGNSNCRARSDILEHAENVNVGFATRGIERGASANVVNMITSNTVDRALGVVADLPLGVDT